MAVLKEITENEDLLKEITMERKTKSRKKRLDLYGKCKKVLLNLVTSWKTTPRAEEESMFETLKEIALKGRNRKKLPLRITTNTSEPCDQSSSMQGVRCNETF
eukprot:TRINITY_DN21456_c0_g1_i1.p2 TRINITY_DN21456_c0_g1~~TRINITY_DN21456_c0_g1_i1.p2  ORF type:complete len:103 (-),score=27.00 TRINITY_DN21456_c0_g1_i1:64-372(-)